MSDYLAHLVEQLSGLPLIQASQLVKRLREKWSIPDVGPTPPLMVPAQKIVSTVEEAIAKDTFTVVLREIGEKKIEVIKAVRQMTQLGLKEAKELVESKAIILEDVDRVRAEEAQKNLVGAGAVVEIV